MNPHAPRRRVRPRARVMVAFVLAVAGSVLAHSANSASGVPLTAVRVVGLPDAASATTVALQVRGLASPAFVRRAADGSFMVQAGAFADATLAQRHAARLSAAGLSNVALQPTGSAAFAPPAVAAQPVKDRESYPAPAARLPPAEATAKQSQPAVRSTKPAMPMMFALGNSADAPRGSSSQAPITGVTWRAARLQAESAAFTGHDRPARHSQFLHASGGLDWRPSASIELRVAARGDGYRHQGWQDHSEIMLDYDEVYLRRRWSSLRLTMGAQRVLWGRVDEIPPTDHMSVTDLTRMALDRLPQRRRTVPAVRAEWFGLPGKLDLVWIPAFRPAELPDEASPWHPVNRRDGRFLSLPSNALQTALIKAGRFDDDGSGSGGGGLRYSQELSAFDYAVSAQRVRHSTPYYELDPRVRTALAGGSDVSSAVALAADTFVGRHPYTWVLGADAGMVTGRTTWRAEAAWLSAAPVTDGAGALDTVNALHAVIGAEFYPGDRDLRVNLQLGSKHLFGPSSLLDRRQRYFTNGSVFFPLGQRRWEFETRYALGLNVRDVYVNPELRYVFAEPHQFYIAAHIFRGTQDTLGGFFHDNTGITLGWRSKL